MPRRMVGRHIVECSTPKMNKYRVAFWNDDQEDIKFEAHRYEVEDACFVFYKGDDKVGSIPQGNVMYVWKENA